MKILSNFQKFDNFKNFQEFVCSKRIYFRDSLDALLPFLHHSSFMIIYLGTVLDRHIFNEIYFWDYIEGTISGQILYKHSYLRESLDTTCCVLFLMNFNFQICHTTSIDTLDSTSTEYSIVGQTSSISTSSNGGASSLGPSDKITTKIYGTITPAPKIQKRTSTISDGKNKVFNYWHYERYKN